jgi:hypothetical protein
MRGAQLKASRPKGESCTTKLILRADDAQIKIEVTPVLRGCVYEAAVKRVSPKVEEEFGFTEVRVVHFADLYAGKIVHWTALETGSHDRAKLHPCGKNTEIEREHARQACCAGISGDILNVPTRRTDGVCNAPLPAMASAWLEDAEPSTQRNSCRVLRARIGAKFSEGHSGRTFPRRSTPDASLQTGGHFAHRCPGRAVCQAGCLSTTDGWSGFSN